VAGVWSSPESFSEFGGVEAVGFEVVCRDALYVVDEGDAEGS
jgi:hypothetical protein